jgi:hypothetical protein
MKIDEIIFCFHNDEKFRDMCINNKELIIKHIKGELHNMMGGGDDIPSYLKPLSTIEKMLLLTDYYTHPEKYKKVKQRVEKEKSLRRSQSQSKPQQLPIIVLPSQQDSIIIEEKTREMNTQLI